MFELKKGILGIVLLCMAGAYLSLMGCFFLLGMKNWWNLIELAIGIFLLYKSIKNYKTRIVLVADSQGFWYNGRVFKWSEINFAQVETRGITGRPGGRNDIFCFQTTDGEYFEVNISNKDHNAESFVHNINRCAGADILNTEYITY